MAVKADREECAVSSSECSDVLVLSCHMEDQAAGTNTILGEKSRKARGDSGAISVPVEKG